MVAVIDGFFGALEMMAVNVADGYDFGGGKAEVISEIPVSAVLAHADESDGDTVAGSDRAIKAQDG
jgi:hypothetical protein